jgi:hypothetical protein
MKTKITIFGAILFALFILTSCATMERTSKTMDIHGAGVIQKPVIADLDVQDKKATGTAVGASKKKLDFLKKQAIADALKKTNADVLIEPSFEVLQEVGKITVTVTGFPGTYKNLRTVKADDTEILKYYNSGGQNTQTNNPQAKKGLTIGAMALGALVILLTVLKP